MCRVVWGVFISPGGPDVGLPTASLTPLGSLFLTQLNMAADASLSF